MFSRLSNLLASATAKRSADTLENDATSTEPPTQRLRLANSIAPPPPSPTRATSNARRGPVRLAVLKPRQTHDEIENAFPGSRVDRLDLNTTRLQWMVNDRDPSVRDVVYYVNSDVDFWRCQRFTTASDGQVARLFLIITGAGVLAQPSAAKSIVTYISNLDGCRLTSLVVAVASSHIAQLEPMPDELNLPMLKDLDINPRLIVRAAKMRTRPDTFRSLKLYTTLSGVLRASFQRDSIDIQLVVIEAFANIQTVRLATPFDVNGTPSGPFLRNLRRLELDLSSEWHEKHIAHAHMWLPAREFVWDGGSRRFNTTVIFENRWIRIQHSTFDDRWSAETVDRGHLRRIEGLLQSEIEQLLKVVPRARLLVCIEANADAKALRVLGEEDMTGLAAVAFELSPLIPGDKQLRHIRSEIAGRLGSDSSLHLVVEVQLWARMPVGSIMPTITEADMLELASGAWFGHIQISVARTVRVVAAAPSVPEPVA